MLVKYKLNLHKLLTLFLLVLFSFQTHHVPALAAGDIKLVADSMGISTEELTRLARTNYQKMVDSKTRITKQSPIDSQQFKTILLSKPKMVRHHLFNKFWGQSPATQKYRDFFKKHGINVDDFCVDIPTTTHMRKVHKYTLDWTNKWRSWIDANPTASTKEVYQFVGRLMDEYEIAHLPIIKYRGKQ